MWHRPASRDGTGRRFTLIHRGKPRSRVPRPSLPYIALPPGSAGLLLAAGEPPAGRANGPTEVPASLDRLDRDRIPADERFEWQPKELVAVLGSHRGRHWGAVAAVAFSPDGKHVA